MNDAIERIYRVFSAYPHPRALDGCPCCTSRQVAQPLVTKPLRALDSQDLEQYAFKALTTWGTVEDYKYFLPRIIELTVSGDLLWDIEMTLGKLAYGDFASWPLHERQAIEDFLLDAWTDAVRSNAVEEADELLCGAARVMDTAPLLELADRIDPEFRDTYRMTCSRHDKRRLRNSYWDRDSERYKAVLDWVYD
ncbi:MAG TPA: hypothetical protein VFV69_20050 [Steroidobacteraceae bacterium]|jgi:hypothetical protein|nr:hypothetical protein [Steroidobacteraceae bacterium]